MHTTLLVAFLTLAVAPPADAPAGTFLYEQATEQERRVARCVRDGASLRCETKVIQIRRPVVIDTTKPFPPELEQLRAAAAGREEDINATCSILVTEATAEYAAQADGAFRRRRTWDQLPPADPCRLVTDETWRRGADGRWTFHDDTHYDGCRPKPQKGVTVRTGERTFATSDPAVALPSVCRKLDLTLLPSR